jgi:hypothetical protein
MPDKTSNPIGNPERSKISDSNQTDRIDDAILLQRVREGDQTAMAEVFDRYGRIVYSVAFRG